MRIGKLLASEDPGEMQALVLKALGYDPDDPAAPEESVAGTVKALRTTAQKKPEEALVGICHMELREDGILYPAVSVFPMADTLLFPHIGKWEMMTLNTAPELDDGDSILVWNLTDQEADSLLRMGDALPKPVEDLAFSQLRSVFLTDENPLFAAALLARYLLDKDLVRGNTQSALRYRELMEEQFRLAGLEMPAKRESCRRLFTAHDRYREMSRWKEKAIMYFLKQDKEEQKWE